MNRDLPTIRSLKLRLLLDQYITGCFFYSIAYSLHALGSDNPLSDVGLQAKAIAVYREMCGILVAESALSVHKDLGKETWGDRPEGGVPQHFPGSAKQVAGNVMLLRTNTCSIVTSSFGMDTPLTLPSGYLDVKPHCVSMGVEIWRSNAVSQQWWLLLKQNVVVRGVEAIFGEQSLITLCR